MDLCVLRILISQMLILLYVLFSLLPQEIKYWFYQGSIPIFLSSFYHACLYISTCFSSFKHAFIKERIHWCEHLTHRVKVLSNASGFSDSTESP